MSLILNNSQVCCLQLYGEKSLCEHDLRFLSIITWLRPWCGNEQQKLGNLYFTWTHLNVIDITVPYVSHRRIMITICIVSKKKISDTNSFYPSVSLSWPQLPWKWLQYKSGIYLFSYGEYMQELNKLCLILHNSFYNRQKAFGKTLFATLADFNTTGSNVFEARARASKCRTCALTQKWVYNCITYLFLVRVTICRQQLPEQCHNITQHNISLWNEKTHLNKFGKSERKIKEVKS